MGFREEMEPSRGLDWWGAAAPEENYLIYLLKKKIGDSGNTVDTPQLHFETEMRRN